MKAKDRRKAERQAEQIRREQSCFPVDLKKLLAVDTFRAEVLRAAEQAEQSRKGGDKELQ